jgi:U4/U6.U5 tri-snRNP component SNU23
MAAGPNDYGRRTWDPRDYEKNAEDESPEKKDEVGPKPKSNLKPREAPVDLESKLGKSVVISKATPTSQAGGFFCDVCDCVVKDSINYLDHINGKKHQRNMGFNMKVQRSSLADVEARFQQSLKKKEETKEEYNVQERLREMREEEEKLKEYRRNQKKEKKKRKREEVDEVDDNEMAKLMGFSSFSSKK